MVSFDYKKNKDLFEDGEKVFDKLFNLRCGRIKSICGSIVYEWNEDYEIPFKIQWCGYPEEGIEPTYWLVLYYGGKEIYRKNVGDDPKEVMDSVDWFFGKAPDDDTYYKIRRDIVKILIGKRNLSNEEFENRCYYLNTLFATNI